MKKNKGLLIALAATGVIAGFGAFLFGTKKGKKLTKSWKKQGEKITEEVKDIIEDAKAKFESLRREFLKENKKQEKAAKETQ